MFDILVSQPPPLLSLDLLQITVSLPPQILSSISQFLDSAQTTLKRIIFDCRDELTDCLVNSKFPHLTSVKVFYDPSEALSVQAILHHFKRGSSGFSRLALIQYPQPSDDGLIPSQMSQELVQLTHELALDSLCLQNCQLPLHGLDCIVAQPTLRDLELVECAGDSQGLKALLSKPSLVSRVYKWSGFSSDDLMCLSQCTRLEYLSFEMSNDLLSDVAKFLPSFKALVKVYIFFPIELVGWNSLIIECITNCHSIHEVVICGHELKEERLVVPWLIHAGKEHSDHLPEFVAKDNEALRGFFSQTQINGMIQRLKVVVPNT